MAAVSFLETEATESDVIESTMMMRTPTALVLCLGLIARVASENFVVELDASNFDSFLENTPIVLVEFYA